MDITDFLNARISEDGAAAESRSSAAPIHETGCYYYNYTLDANWFCDCDGPERAKKEAIAKRAIVAEYNGPGLAALAQVYSEHPDFDIAWAQK